MKKSLLLITLLSLVGCSEYTAEDERAYRRAMNKQAESFTRCIHGYLFYDNKQIFSETGKGVTCVE